MQLGGAGAVGSVVVVGLRVETRIVLEAGPPGEQLADELRVHGAKVVLAGGRNQLPVERGKAHARFEHPPAQAVHRQPVGPFVGQHLLEGEMCSGGVLKRFLGDAADLAGPVLERRDQIGGFRTKLHLAELLGVMLEGNDAHRDAEELLDSFAWFRGFGDAEQLALAEPLLRVDHPHAVLDGVEVVERLDEVDAGSAILPDGAMLDAQADEEDGGQTPTLRPLAAAGRRRPGCGCRT